MKRPFEVGDRVRVYCGANRYKGEVTRVWSDGLVDVKYALAGGSNSIATFQEKQCRRLKPKPKPEKKEARRVW